MLTTVEDVISILAGLIAILAPLFPTPTQINGQMKQAAADREAADATQAKIDAIPPLNPSSIDGRLLDGTA